MDSEKRKFWVVLAFAVLFATLVFVSVGCASGTTPPEEAWNKTFGGTDDDGASAIQQTADGGFILAGYTGSHGAGGADIWLVKTVSNGTEQWNQTFGEANNDWAYSVQQTSDNGYILAGSTESYGAGSWDFWLVKTDFNGNEQWNRTFGGTGYDFASSVQQTLDGGYILAGSTESYGAGSWDFWLVKTDSVGGELWNKTFGGTDDDFASSVQQTLDCSYILAGETRSYGAGFSDAWLIMVKGEPTIPIFDTEQSENPYPSIMGTHKGEIKPSDNINVSKLYTYPCIGTGGHTESIELYDENDTLIASGMWKGYQGDCRNITITPSVTLLAGHTYNYTIITGSYPQIIHAKSKDVTGGTITCTSFVDANGKMYFDWIPAIRLE